jgi:hypothetical protein
MKLTSFKVRGPGWVEIGLPPCPCGCDHVVSFCADAGKDFHRCSEEPHRWEQLLVCVGCSEILWRSGNAELLTGKE